MVERGASVVALARPSSASTSSPLLEGAKVVTADYADVKAVASILREHKVEVVISALAYGALPSQSTIADAAKEAGVKLFVPSEYGMPTEGGTAGHLLIKTQFSGEPFCVVPGLVQVIEWPWFDRLSEVIGHSFVADLRKCPLSSIPGRAIDSL